MGAVLGAVVPSVHALQSCNTRTQRGTRTYPRLQRRRGFLTRPWATVSVGAWSTFTARAHTIHARRWWWHSLIDACELTCESVSTELQLTMYIDCVKRACCIHPRSGNDQFGIVASEGRGGAYELRLNCTCSMQFYCAVRMVR